MNILFVLNRIGPYHQARFKKISLAHKLFILETLPYSEEYDWNVNQSDCYKLFTLRKGRTSETEPCLKYIKLDVNNVFKTCKIDAVVLTGWSTLSRIYLLKIANKLKIPSIILSDSRLTDTDVSRIFIKEFFKRKILKFFSSAIVAGKESKSYLEHLSFPSSKIFQPLDVVDNDLFFNKTNNIDLDEKKPFFLCISRLVEKKNIKFLLKTYEKYYCLGGKFRLVIIGGGNYFDELTKYKNNLKSSNLISIYPFMQLESIFEFYGKASYFILPSKSDQWGLVVNEALAAGLPCIVSDACGCAVDLVKKNINGWIFNSNDEINLINIFFECQNKSKEDRLKMVNECYKIIKQYSLNSFLDAFNNSLNLVNRGEPISLIDKIYLNTLLLILNLKIVLKI